MNEIVLLHDSYDHLVVIPRRVRLFDRLLARLHAHKIDEEIAEGAAPETSVAHGIRAATLICEDTRDELAASLRRIACLEDHRPSISQIPLARGAVGEAKGSIEALSRRLRSPEPVDARGVAQVRLLLSDGRGPLFDSDRGDELQAALGDAIEALEPRVLAG